MKYTPRPEDLASHANLIEALTRLNCVPGPGQSVRCEHLRALGREVGKEIMQACPPSESLDDALFHLATAVQCGITAITEDEGKPVVQVPTAETLDKIAASLAAEGHAP